MNSNWGYNPINSTQLGNLEEKHKSPEQVIIMIITTRWSDHIQENNIKVKAGWVLINYSHAIRSRDPEQWWLSGSSWSRQRNIPAAQKILEISLSILVRELIVSPHSENPGLLLLKYREYLRKLYSLDTWCLTEQTNVLRSDTTSIQSIIQHARYGQQCCISAGCSLALTGQFRRNWAWKRSC